MKVLVFVYEVLMLGYLGISRMIDRVLVEFYWLGV